MRFLVLLIALIAGPALAADVAPVKAPAVPLCSTTSCSGWYVGGQIEGAGPISTGQADLTNGVGLGVHGGYQLWNGSWFAAIEVGATGYTGASTVIFTPAPGASAPASAGRWSADEIAKIGYGLQGLFSTGSVTAPSQGLFANLNANLVSPYLEVGVRERAFGTGFVVGAGLEYTIGNGYNAFLDYRHINYNDTVANVSIGGESVVIGGINRKFSF